MPQPSDDHFSRRVTLKDVAAKAGLSVAAVSLALRDQPRLPKATRERVKRIAVKLGYAPDPALSALAAHRSRVRVFRDFSVIGLVSNWSTRDEWSRRPSAQSLIEGAQARARELGYTLQHLWAREGGISPARFDGILHARGIRGLILAPFQDLGDQWSLDWKSYSVVTIERPAQLARLHHIVPNHFADLLVCWENLRARGYTRVGLAVRADLAVRWSHQWEAAHAYAQARGAAKLDRIPTLEVNPEGQGEQIRSWLRAHRPEAVIARCDNFLEAAEAEGLRVPFDLGYVSLNTIDDVPDATGIDQQRNIMGATAVDVLNTLLQRNQRGFQPASIGTQIDGVWRVGATLADQPPGRLPVRKKRTGRQAQPRRKRTNSVGETP